jgi:hypothetical protein
MKLPRTIAACITFVAIGIALAACQAQASVGVEPDIGGCSQDPTVDCSGGGWGYSCAQGNNPEDEDSSLSCSVPAPDSDGNDDYCCFTWSPQGGGSSCTPDDALTSACPDPDSYGYQCAEPNDDPTSLDPTLNCSQGEPDADGTDADFCCNYGQPYGGGGTYPTGCSPDSTVDCSGSGAEGYSCGAGDNPENYDNLVCSDPTPNGSEDDFCCFPGGSAFSQTTCYPDDSLTSFCQDGSYGFQCDSGDDPTSYDATLTCSDNQPDPDGVHDDYCCTY